MSIVYSYIRFSSKKQEKGDSLRRQTELADDYCERHGHQLADLTLRDLGVSAFRGKHKHEGALSVFLQAIEDGQIKPGSILLVENLDRLSREGMAEALSLFLSILKAGVKIAVLEPMERLYTRQSVNDLVGILEPLMSFHLAHEESLKRSKRLKHHWNQRRRNAADKPLSKVRPSWIDWNEDEERFEINEEAAAAIRTIFEAAIDGLGQRRTLDRLNEQHKPIGRSGRWNTSFIQKVLNDRAVLGEFQPMTFDDDGRRIPTGDPISDYYPAVIDEATWQRARAAKESRRKHKSPSREFVNLFSGLARSAWDKSTLNILTTRTKRKNGETYIQRRLYSYNKRRQQKGADPFSFDYYALEKAVLTFLSEVSSSDLEPTKLDQTSRQDEIEGNLLRIEKRLDDLETSLSESDDPTPRLLNAIRKLEQQETELKAELEKLKADQQGEPLEEAQSLISSLDSNEKKLKLKSILPRLIQDMSILLYSPGKRRVCAVVQIYFAEQEQMPRIIHLDRDEAYAYDAAFPQIDFREAPKKQLREYVKLWTESPKAPYYAPKGRLLVKLREGYRLNGARDNHI